MIMDVVNWYLRLMYKCGRTPQFYVGRNKTKQALRFLAVNEISQRIYEAPHGLFLSRKKLCDNRYVYYNRI